MSETNVPSPEAKALERDAQFAELLAWSERDAAALAHGEQADGEREPVTVEGRGTDETVADAATVPARVPVVHYDRRPSSRPWPLRYPFTIDGVRIASLHFREPTFADVEDCVSGRITEHELHARMAGVSLQTMKAMRWSDSEIMTLVARAIAPELKGE